MAVARELTTPKGFWSRDRLVKEYAGIHTLPMEYLHLCIALSCLKLAVVLESVHYRYLSGQALDQLSAGLADAAPALLQMSLLVAEGEGLRALAARSGPLPRRLCRHVPSAARIATAAPPHWRTSGSRTGNRRSRSAGYREA